MAADTSSSAAGTNFVVKAAAAALASLTVAPIFAKCFAAAATTSVFTITNDTVFPQNDAAPAGPSLSNTIVVPARGPAFGRSLGSYQTNGASPANAWYRGESALRKVG